jgi:hypothetical protein
MRHVALDLKQSTCDFLMFVVGVAKAEHSSVRHLFVRHSAATSSHIVAAQNAMSLCGDHPRSLYLRSASERGFSAALHVEFQPDGPASARTSYRRLRAIACEKDLIRPTQYPLTAILLLAV